MANYEIPITDGNVQVRLPDQWRVNYRPMKDLPALSAAELKAAFAQPIGTASIREMARGQQKAVVIVEDTTRSLPGHQIVPLVIEELQAGGLAPGNIRIVMGIGAHRPMAQREFRRKLGDWVVDNYLVVNNNCYENQVFVGTTEKGTPVEVSYDVAEADLRITVGALIPHNSAGYTGGGKLILPGVCSMKTISHHHETFRAGQGGFGEVECGFRQEIEAVARVAKLDVIVEGVLNSRLEVVGLFVGDLVAAHRAGVQLGNEVYTVTAPSNVDVGVVSGFPRDVELPQGMAALAPHTGSQTVRKGGTVLFMAAAQEGVGFHSLRDKWLLNRGRAMPRPWRMVVYAPQISPVEALASLPPGSKVFDDIDEAVAMVASLHPEASANVFPHGAMTICRPV